MAAHTQGYSISGAQGDALARHVTRALNGEWDSRKLCGRAPGPGHSKKDRSLSVTASNNDPFDVTLYSFAGDDVLAIKTDLRSRGILPSRGPRRAPHPQAAAKAHAEAEARRARSEREAAAEAARRLAIAIELWGRSEPAGGTAGEAYLKWRGIDIDPLPATLRYLAPNPPEYPFPSMIAAFGLASEPEPGRIGIPLHRIHGVHLTYLKPDGFGKAPVEPSKRMIGHSLGWPIVLAPPSDGLALLIGEGIETTLWGNQASGMGAWAAGTAGRMPALADKVPDYIESVTIAVDADPEGERRSNELAERLAARGFEVLLSKAVSHGA